LSDEANRGKNSVSQAFWILSAWLTSVAKNMPGAFTLEWRDGREEDLYGHRGYYYVFSDHTILSFLPEPAWCRHCEQIRLCEHLRDEAALRQELRECADPNSELSLRLAKSLAPGFAETWKQKLEVQLRHVTLRKMPPSCIHCGHRDIAYFVEDQWAPHPGTGEEVQFYCSGMCSTDFARRFYDVDCNPLILTEEEEAALREAVRQDRAY
jgi:hypothetical protein